MINFHKNSNCSFCIFPRYMYDEFIVKIRSARYKFVMYAMSIFFLLCRMCLEYNRREVEKKIGSVLWIDGNITFEIFTHSTRENVETVFELIFQEYPGRFFHGDNIRWYFWQIEIPKQKWIFVWFVEIGTKWKMEHVLKMKFKYKIFCSFNNFISNHKNDNFPPQAW